ncbi:MAG: Hsp20/alpha crystallin family protein [Zetaproteobacteria bacterium]|nr:MAG: Hsp20/alpha crystallin family protein [Zetaproteobacteria bacterium]
MTLLRRTPWQELEQLNRQLSSLFDGTPFATMTHESDVWVPAVDIRETDDALLVQAELPGLEKKEVNLEIKEGVLTISGERRYEKDVNEDNVHRIERSYGRFSRSFSLPNNIDTDKVHATMKNGVLEIRLPKRESAKARAITIH